MIARATICMLALLLAAGCRQAPPTSAATAAEAVRVTDLYRAEHFPRARPSRVVTEDGGDRWLVSYIRLEGGTGGLATYEVDKRTARILSEGGAQ
jgi:ABC-type Fe3+-hydroxamate transport system substrate-binding protein